MFRFEAIIAGILLPVSSWVLPVAGSPSNDELMDWLKDCLGGDTPLENKLDEMKMEGKNLTDANCIDQALKGCLSQAFVEEQFRLWKEHECDRFVDTFTDDFEYCDVTPCTNDKSLVGGNLLCNNTGAHEIHEIDLIVKPRMWPYDGTCQGAPLYDDVIATGLQTVNMSGAFFCTDFAIAEKLVWEEGASTIDHVKSSEWKGYYTWTPGRCGITAAKGTLERVGALLSNLFASS